LYKPNINGVARIVHPPTTLTDTNIDVPSSPIAENAGFIFNKKNKKQMHKLNSKRMINPPFYPSNGSGLTEN